MEIRLLFVVFTYTLAAPTFRTGSDTKERNSKNMAYFDIQPEVDYYDSYDNYYDDNELSRTVPTRKRVRKPVQYNSPIYYIRLPPQPYMFVPGLGYVSQPPANPMNQFLNVPIDFVSNGKPNGIYQWNGDVAIPPVAPSTTTQRPFKKRPDSTVHRIKGQFTFNGRPEDIFVLDDSYNSLYGDVLQNLYP